MDTQSQHWLPLTEYALRSGMSISTLRRRIKASTIEYKMEDGRYLIRGDELSEGGGNLGYASSDGATRSMEPEASALARLAREKISAGLSTQEVEQIREELKRMQDENLLRWKMLEARVVGLAKKMEFVSDQLAEAKMLVKIFEERLDQRG